MITKRSKIGVISVLFVMLSCVVFSPRASAVTPFLDIKLANAGGNVSQKVAITVTASMTSGGAPYTGATIKNIQLISYGTNIPASAAQDLTDAGNGLYTATFDLSPFPVGTYYFNVTIDGANGISVVIDYSQTQWGTSGPVASWDATSDTVIVASVPFSSLEGLTAAAGDTIVPTWNITSAWFEVIPVGGGAPVATGNLSFSGGAWTGQSSSMAWHNGNFITVARCVLVNGKTITSPASVAFTRSNNTETIIIYVVLIGVFIVAAIVVVVMIKKRGGQLKAKEKVEKKEIKVLKVDQSEIKKAKQGKAPKPKPENKEPEKKGVTKKSEDLIFEVPKWEDEDEENT